MKAAVRKRFIEAWAHKRDCFWCGKPFTYRGKLAPTIEHFIPKSRGGRGWQANLVVAHARCNNSRQNRIPNENEMRQFVQVKGKTGIHNLFLFAKELEALIASRNSISGRVS